MPFYSAVALLAILPLIGPYVEHGIAATIDSLSVIVMGILIGLLYFTESAFNQAGNQHPLGKMD